MLNLTLLLKISDQLFHKTRNQLIAYGYQSDA
jgi:hypothetical protein